ncbi:ABATE domain-containing protein [Frankia sp. CNm7]|uniref:ABATE domain-containing protein n=1 Tax=Frankia nepalensis TaxID=1836974 RepID=A0A937RQ31_9ACTN|nr:ABATE domain-containing protein [Frankia nepalensis]MBL7501108.1 ABATE domain-containing protein [Frankia nepalensis]MBL7512730.1 ABATE domain-containing protein [Frankia nepalensis]MBL7524120.1 ABATE domain-containing protein [Frankia nepalensis]MBL7631314.1 ABATE domain-containing protein [Frankia nepalensis]
MEQAHPERGGAPILGEPPAIELGNTIHAARGRPRDALLTVPDLVDWLRAMRPRLAAALTDDDLLDAGEDDLRMARALRDTIRALADAAANGRAPDPDVVTALNRLARRTSWWRELRVDPEPRVVVSSAERPVALVLTALADDAVGLFGGPAGAEVRACHGPGCILYFLHGAPRREYCSAGCGNRARAARHYARTRRAH